MILFDRRYRLKVGGVVLPAKDPVTGLRGAGPENLEVREWTELRINFSINKDMSSESNTSKIDIYNLSKKSQEFLIQAVNRKVELEVGYGDSLGLLLKSDIIDVKRTRARPEVFLTLECGEGEVILTEAIQKKSYKKDVPLKNIIIETVGNLNLNVGPTLRGFLDQNVTQAIGSELNGDGSVKKFLDSVLAKAGYTWSIQNDEFVINEFANNAQAEIFVLDFGSGLLKEPEETEDGKLKINCLINPKIIPGRVVRITTPGIDGTFQVENAIYNGDSYEGEWTMSAEVIAA